ncbi:MAG: type II secretion system protein [Pseudomonadota bacterium]
MKRAQGFTLVELIIGMTAGAVVSLVAVFLLMPAQNWVHIMERRSGMAEAELATTRLILEAGRIKSPEDITVFTSTHLTFVDIDDQAVDFSLTGTDLLRGTDALARNVQSLTFEYLKKDATAAAAAADIRTVRVTIVITAGQQTVRLQSAAQIKNGV